MPQEKKRTKESGAQKESKRPRKETKQKKKKDPDAPKKPLTAFFVFLGDKREKYVKEHPTTKLTEVTKALSEVWKSLSADQKRQYEEKAANDKKRYEQEMKSYVPPAADDSDDEPESKKKKKVKDPNAPKRPMSAYMLFSNDKGPSIRAENKSDVKGAMARIAAAWKDADKATKEKYEKLAQEDKKRYTKEMEEFKKGKGHAKAKPAEDEEDADESEEEDEEEQEAAPKKKKKKVVADDDDDDDDDADEDDDE